MEDIKGLLHRWQNLTAQDEPRSISQVECQPTWEGFAPEIRDLSQSREYHNGWHPHCGGGLNIPMGGRGGGFSIRTIIILVIIYFALKMFFGIDLLKSIRTG